MYRWSLYRCKGCNTPEYAAVSAHSPVAAQLNEGVEHLHQQYFVSVRLQYEYIYIHTVVCRLPNLLYDVLGLRAINSTSARVVEDEVAPTAAWAGLRFSEYIDDKALVHILARLPIISDCHSPGGEELYVRGGRVWRGQESAQERSHRPPEVGRIRRPLQHHVHLSMLQQIYRQVRVRVRF